MSERAEQGSIHLVGTAHVSEKSVEAVREAIDTHDPDTVAVELDEGRYRQMSGEEDMNIEASDLLEGSTIFQFLAYWMLSYIQSRMGSKFDIEPGADMRAAIEAAEERGLEIALVDRDIQVTIQRFWKRLTLKEKFGLFGGLLFEFLTPLEAGIMVGLTVGSMIGLILATIGAGSLGLWAIVAGATPPSVFLAIGGIVGGAIVGLGLVFGFDDMLKRFYRPLGGPATLEGRALVTMAVGGVTGVILSLGTARGLGPSSIAFVSGLSLTLGRSFVQFLFGLGIGISVFGLLGLLLGLLLERIIEPPEDVDIDLSELTDADVVTALLEEFRRFSPGGARALIDERDAYIAHELLTLREAGKRVVAVVGAGHKSGIEAHLSDPSTLPPKQSLMEPAKSRRISVISVIGYLFTFGFVVFFGLLALGGAETPFLLKIVGSWILFNGILAFSLARIAGARLLSATVGGAVAWLTSLNPLLAPGWFVGFIELRYQSVNISDIKTLNELLQDETRPMRNIIEDMFDVPLFRLIMIVAMTNIGSMIASTLFLVVILPMLAPGNDLGYVIELAFRGANNGISIILDVLT